MTLKPQEILKFSDIIRVYKNITLTENWVISNTLKNLKPKLLLH